VQLRAAIAAAAALAACGDRRRDDEAGPAAPSTPPQPPPQERPPPDAPHALRPIAELREHAVLVEGTRRIALWVGDAGWYEPDARGLAAQPLLGAALARARADLEEPTDVFLGTRPVLSGGAEHHERVIGFAPAPRELALHGLPLQVVTAGPVEVWRYEHELRMELATVDDAGAVAALPALPRLGPDAEALSTVGAKACAAPKVRDLAGTGDAVLALVTECHPRAPVRIATYRWPAGGAAPARQIATLSSLAELDLQIDHLLAARDGAPILVGRRGGAVIVLRPSAGSSSAGSSSAGSSSAGAGSGTPAPPVTSRGPAGVEAVTHAAIADDGAVWIRALARGEQHRDRVELARDGAPVPLASPAGARLRAESLSFDERLGIVVLATEGATRWLLAERPPPGRPVVLPPP
jgi:hypothetical protein